MTSRSLTRYLAVSLLAVAPALAACGDDDESSTDTTEVDESTETADAATDGAAGDEDGGGSGIDTSDPEQVAAAEAWTTVFDSSVPAGDKAPHLEDPAAVADTLAAYAATGDAMQGITLAATDVAVDGETATVTYDILFAGTPTYEDQTGEVVNVDGAWTVTTDQFCSFMATARTPCA